MEITEEQYARIQDSLPWHLKTDLSFEADAGSTSILAKWTVHISSSQSPVGQGSTHGSWRQKLQ
jgi:hypothetical protein